MFLGPKCVGIEKTFQVDSGHYRIMVMMMMMAMRMMTMTNLLKNVLLYVKLAKDFKLHMTYYFTFKYKSPSFSPIHHQGIFVEFHHRGPPLSACVACFFRSFTQRLKLRGPNHWPMDAPEGKRVRGTQTSQPWVFCSTYHGKPLAHNF